MNAEELRKEITLRLEVNEWIKDTLLPKFIKSNGEPVSFTIPHQLHPAQSASIIESSGAQDYLKSLEYILTIKDCHTNGIYDNHYYDLVISLPMSPVKTSKRAD